MISPELLRRYPFFGTINDQQLKEIAQISEEEELIKGTTVFEEGQPADFLYLLLEGSVDLFFRSEEIHPKGRREFHVGEINPGEVFAISALIEPYILNATCRTDKNCRLVKIDAKALRTLIEQDATLSCRLVMQAAKVMKERLAATRVLLAAAWA